MDSLKTPPSHTVPARRRQAGGGSARVPESAHSPLWALREETCAMPRHMGPAGHSEVRVLCWQRSWGLHAGACRAHTRHSKRTGSFRGGQQARMAGTLAWARQGRVLLVLLARALPGHCYVSTLPVGQQSSSPSGPKMMAFQCMMFSACGEAFTPSGGSCCSPAGRGWCGGGGV